jgi:D-hydroxyproline dehydrogenase subunit gamma
MPRISPGVERPAPLTIHVDGQPVAAHRGESIAAAMIAAGIVRFRDDGSGRPRGLWCNMGSCHECTVTLADGARVRACITPVAEGMAVSTHG